MAKDTEKANNQIEKSRLQSAVLDYKRSKKLVKCGIIAISVISILLLIFLTSGWNSYRASLTDGVVNGADGKDGDTPYIGANGNWWIGETDTGISAAGKDGAAGADGSDGATPHIGENGNWWIGETDTGISAAGKDGEAGEDGADGNTPYIGENGNWWIGETDTEIPARGEAGEDGEDGKDGHNGATPYIGANGNWWIGNTDTGVSASGGGGGNDGGGSGGSGPASDGSFTVKLDPNNGEKSIAISETPGFANPTDNLKTNGLNNAWNITYEDIPVETIKEAGGGANNGANYFAYTFYVKNTGIGALSCTELLTLTENNLDAVKAIRVMVFRNDEVIRYAAPAANGEKEEFACDESFTGDVNLISKEHSLAEGEVMRYTIVVWFEGNDPECIDDIRGGSVKLDLSFKIN